MVRWRLMKLDRPGGDYASEPFARLKISTFIPNQLHQAQTYRAIPRLQPKTKNIFHPACARSPIPRLASSSAACHDPPVPQTWPDRMLRKS
jgi:hypothetical protein